MGTWRLSRRVARQESGASDTRRFAEWIDKGTVRRSQWYGCQVAGDLTGYLSELWCVFISAYKINSIKLY
jgi:hypothetical protein